MARVLIVGCGCRGRELAAALVEGGCAVRATTRRPDGVEAIAATGAEGVVADPSRLATLMPQIDGVSAICWLMGSADGGKGAVAALHGPRLQSLLERLVDTPVRGFVYEAAGSAGAEVLEAGGRLVHRAGETYRMPVVLVPADPTAHEVWLEAMVAAVGRILGPA